MYARVMVLGIMKKYKKADNCGPVPYPDQSGRMLTDQIVSGDEWEKYVPLGYVVEVKDAKVKKPETAPSAPASFAKTNKASSKLNKLRELHSQGKPVKAESASVDVSASQPEAPATSDTPAVVENPEIKES